MNTFLFSSCLFNVRLFSLRLLFLSLIFVSFGVIPAFAQSSSSSSTSDSRQPPPGKHHDGKLHILPDGLFALQLSSEQLLAVKQLISDNMEEWETLSNEVRTVSADLEEAINLDTFDEQTVRDAAKNLEATDEEQLVLKAKITATVRSILTDEQRATLDVMRLAHIYNAPPQVLNESEEDGDSAEDSSSSDETASSDSAELDSTESDSAQPDSAVYESDSIKTYAPVMS